LSVLLRLWWDYVTAVRATCAEVCSAPLW